MNFHDEKREILSVLDFEVKLSMDAINYRKRCDNLLIRSDFLRHKHARLNAKRQLSNV